MNQFVKPVTVCTAEKPVHTYFQKIVCTETKSVAFMLVIDQPHDLYWFKFIFSGHGYGKVV